MTLDMFSSRARSGSPLDLSAMEGPLSPPDTECASPASGSRCSSVCSPLSHDSPPPPQVVRPPHPQANALNITNFCIEEILKPNFGIKVGEERLSRERQSAFSPWGRSKHEKDMYRSNAALGAMFGRSLASFAMPCNLSQHRAVTSPPWMTTAAAASAAAAAARSTVRHKPYSYPPAHRHPPSPPESPSLPASPTLPKDEPRRSPLHHSEGTKDGEDVKKEGDVLWPAWVYCTRYSDRPSSGPRSRKIKRQEPAQPVTSDENSDDKRPRTAFTNEQLNRLKREFDENRYLTEERRQRLATELQLNESQIKIWFQNKRAKMKKASGPRNGLALQLMAQGLYNHSTVPLPDDGSEPTS